MNDNNQGNCGENITFPPQQNDVVSLCPQSTMETEEEATPLLLPSNADDLNQNDLVDGTGKVIENLTATSAAKDPVGGKVKAKRRRKKSKNKSNKNPYRQTNWKFQQRQQRCLRHNVVDDADSAGGGNLVPYNTNKFLMEEHMSELLKSSRLSPNGHTRDSSFSVDESEENYFNAAPEDEEAFLDKDFSIAYEDARTERLDGMSKNQLIHEYLQLEANYDKLSKNLGARKSVDDNAKEEQEAQNFEKEKMIRCLEERVTELSAENLELRRQLVDVRNRRNHRNSHHNSPSRNRRASGGVAENSSSSSSSEDSESDSSTDDSSDSDDDSAFSAAAAADNQQNKTIVNNHIQLNNRSSRSRSSCSSKSSLSDDEDHNFVNGGIAADEINGGRGLNNENFRENSI